MACKLFAAGGLGMKCRQAHSKSSLAIHLSPLLHARWAFCFHWELEVLERTTCLASQICEVSALFKCVPPSRWTSDVQNVNECNGCDCEKSTTCLYRSWTSSGSCISQAVWRDYGRLRRTPWRQPKPRILNTHRINEVRIKRIANHESHIRCDP